VPFRIGSRWASDFGYVTHHEPWFWHIAGQRVLSQVLVRLPDAVARGLALPLEAAGLAERL